MVGRLVEGSPIVFKLLSFAPRTSCCTILCRVGRVHWHPTDSQSQSDDVRDEHCNEEETRRELGHINVMSMSGGAVVFDRVTKPSSPSEVLVDYYDPRSRSHEGIPRNPRGNLCLPAPLLIPSHHFAKFNSDSTQSPPAQRSFRLSLPTACRLRSKQRYWVVNAPTEHKDWTILLDRQSG